MKAIADPEITPKIRARFWKRAIVRDRCWGWSGAISNKGYAQLSFGASNSHPASRVSYRIHYGEIPVGMLVCHRCDNPECVRPDHLFIGTQKDNMHDCALKGRKDRFLSSAQVKEIRELVTLKNSLGLTYADIAKRFGVSRAMAHHIGRGTRRSAVPYTDRRTA